MFNLDQHYEVHQQQKSDDDKMHRQVPTYQYKKLFYV